MKIFRITLLMTSFFLQSCATVSDKSSVKSYRDIVKAGEASVNYESYIGRVRAAQEAKKVQDSSQKNHEKNIVEEDEMFPRKVFPVWVTENCIRKSNNERDYYYFIGYGEGGNGSSAVSNALINSRQNALTCIFGGTISLKVSLKENNKSASFNSSTELSLSYGDLNWSGFEKVPDRDFYADDSQKKIYLQYRWAIEEIEKEKIRLKEISKKIDETRAIEKEVQIKKKIIEKQKSQLAVLNRQAIELESIKLESEKTIRKLKYISSVKANKETELRNIIQQIPCGMTIGEFVNVFRKWDRAVGRQGSGESYNHSFWDDWMLVVEIWARVLTDKQVDIIKQKPLQYFYVKKGLTNTYWDVCKKQFIEGGWRKSQ